MTSESFLGSYVLAASRPVTATGGCCAAAECPPTVHPAATISYINLHPPGLCKCREGAVPHGRGELRTLSSRRSSLSSSFGKVQFTFLGLHRIREQVECRCNFSTDDGCPSRRYSRQRGAVLVQMWGKAQYRSAARKNTMAATKHIPARPATTQITQTRSPTKDVSVGMSATEPKCSGRIATKHAAALLISFVLFATSNAKGLALHCWTRRQDSARCRSGYSVSGRGIFMRIGFNTSPNFNYTLPACACVGRAQCHFRRPSL